MSSRTLPDEGVDGELPIWRHVWISHTTITVIERIPGWTGARRNRTLAQVDHLRLSGHIDGSSIVAESIKRPPRRAGTGAERYQ